MKLDLGSLNDSIDYIDDPIFSEPSYDSSGRCWTIRNWGSKVEELKVVPEEPVTCPIFFMLHTDGELDTTFGRNEIKCYVETCILKEVKRIQETIGCPKDTRNFVIPIRKELKFETNKECVLFGYIELGIMVFET